MRPLDNVKVLQAVAMRPPEICRRVQEGARRPPEISLEVQAVAWRPPDILRNLPDYATIAKVGYIGLLYKA